MGRGILRCMAKVYYIRGSRVSISPVWLFISFSSLQHIESNSRIPFHVPVCEMIFRPYVLVFLCPIGSPGHDICKSFPPGNTGDTYNAFARIRDTLKSISGLDMGWYTRQGQMVR